jgi:hypothetical protein
LGSIGIPSSFNMNFGCQTTSLGFPIMVTAATVCVPSGCLEAVSVVLGEVKFSAARCATATRIAIGVAILRIREIKIVVHVAMRI